MEFEQLKLKFINEAFGLTNSLEETLLDNEGNLDNEDNVKQIFRVMHTLKGVSSMYGFDYIGELSHDLETIFDLIRDHKKEFTQSIFDITLKSIDHFRNLLQDEKLEKEDNKANHIQLLNNVSLLVINDDDNTTEEDNIIEDDNKETFYIILYPNDNLTLRNINILRLFEELAELGEYKIVNHTFKEHENQYKDHNAWGVYLVTEKGIDSIEDVFMFILDECKILKISSRNLFRHSDFVKKLDSLKSNNNNQKVKQLQVNLETTISSINSEVLESEEQNDRNIEHASEKKAAKTSNNINIGATDLSRKVTSNISIDSSKLDQLMHLVSELVITKSQLNLAVKNKDYTKLITITEKIDDLSRSFRENALRIRLVSVAEMIMPFKRLVRDLSKELGKDITLTTQGTETELDKNVIDRLAEPIMHIIRNSIDHGIENNDIRKSLNKPPHGKIEFKSFYSGANVIIQINDDGSGIDANIIKEKAIEKGLISSDSNLTEKEIFDLIFLPGFSTANKISEVSGRGVGMDIVRKKIQELRGEVDINSALGKGTTITIKLHQTLSIIDTLLLQVDNSHYLIPISDIEFCEQESHQKLYKNNNRQIEINNNLIPFVSIRDIFNHNTEYPTKEKIIVINKNESKIAIIADKIIGEHQAVLKPLGEVFQSQEYLSGASVLGDGSLALMLDTNKLSKKNTYTPN